MERYSKFTTTILNLNRCINKIKDGEMSQIGLRGTNVTCLYYIYSAKREVTATDIVKLSGEDKAVVSRSVMELEKLGFIECEKTTEKKYRTVLRLTQKGWDSAKFISDKICSFLDLATEGLSQAERDGMLYAMDTICQNLKKSCEKYDKKGK